MALDFSRLGWKTITQARDKNTHANRPHNSQRASRREKCKGHPFWVHMALLSASPATERANPPS